MTAKKIIYDPLFLSQPAAKATKNDLQVAQDLLDTLMVHRESKDGLPAAAGLAANMIGEKKAIIALFAGFLPMVMLNPRIVKKSGAYLTQEGCLSLEGERPVQRYKEIEVSYQDLGMQAHQQTFTDFTAEIIQHEVDHCLGKLI